MKRGYEESSSSASLGPPQSKVRHNPDGIFLDLSSTVHFLSMIFDLRVLGDVLFDDFGYSVEKSAIPTNKNRN